MKPYIVRTAIVYTIILTAGVMVVVGIITQLSSPVHAEDAGWTSPSVTGALDKTRSVDDVTNMWLNHTTQCTKTTILSENKLNEDSACIFQAKTFQLAREYGCQPYWYNGCTKEYWMDIGTGNGTSFQIIDGLQALPSDSCWQVVAGSDQVVMQCSGGLEVVDGLAGRLVAPSGGLSGGASTEPYVTHQLQNSKGNVPVIGSVAMSNNGEWLVGEIQNYGLFRLHLTDGSVTIFTTNVMRYNSGMDPLYEFSITNDGQYVAVGGMNAGAMVYQVDQSCGVRTTNYQLEWQNLGSNYTECLSQDLHQILNNANGGVNARFYKISNLRFSDDESSLELLEIIRDPVEGAYSWWVNLTAPGLISNPGQPSSNGPPPTSPTGIKYLALGDSYSSGEGDITQGSGYYLPGTDGDGQCHVSNRSYPFLLRDYYHVDSSDMKSVACSGALVVPDYYTYGTDYSHYDYNIGPSNTYWGQHRQLLPSSESDRETTRGNALKNYTPGVVKQIDFVKKAQPDVITFTGGGNDVKFKDILQYCAQPDLSTSNLLTPILSPLQDQDPTLMAVKVFGPYTCRYAITGSDMNTLLNNSIDTQYKYDVKLINDLKKSSPNSRIIVVGYPSFVAVGDTSCNVADTADLDGQDRDMINGAVHRLDTVLQAVAHDTEVSYVDTEDSLVGGRVCEAGRYVNSIKDVGFYNTIILKDPSPFHPNALGQEKLAETIISTDAFDKPDVPPESSFVQRSDLVTTQSATFTSDVHNTTNGPLQIAADPGSFASKSRVQIVGHSDETDLGTYTTNADGSLTASVPVDNMPPGIHVLVFNGTGTDNQQVVYYQFVQFVDPTTSNNQVTGGVNANGYHNTGLQPHSSQLVGDTNDESVLGITTTNKNNLLTDKSLDGKGSSHSESANNRGFTLNDGYLIGVVGLFIILLVGVAYAKQRFSIRGK